MTDWLGKYWKWILAGAAGIALIIVLAALFTSGGGLPAKAPAAGETPVPSEAAASIEEPPSLPATRIVEQPGGGWVAEKDGAAMIHVPAGDFTMGSLDVGDEERPVHTANLDGYWINKTEVTNAMFARFINETSYKTGAENADTGWVANDKGKWVKAEGADWQHPRGSDSSIAGLGNHPVVQVSWNDAKAYCAWAGLQLPTEAEWEKAARGTDERRYPWGNAAASPAGLLNFADRSLKVNWANAKVDDGYEFTAPVGSYPAGVSPYGVLDMSGNVWEWAADRYFEYYYQNSSARNPAGPSTGNNRVLRGGSWFNDVRDTRTTYRASELPGESYSDLGFRCVLHETP
jgi:formylglycine-generating enzyme required for sulfatase activity